MSSEQKNNANFPLIPKSERKCVWMELGVVSYKICDRNFECETCPLDIGLRGDYHIMNRPKQEILEKVHSNISEHSSTRKHNRSLERLIKYKLDEYCYVHPGHCWIKVLDKNKVKIGIDDIVATTLGSIDSVILPLPGESIRRGSYCGQIIQFEHIFSIVSPLSGQILKVNKALESFPNKLTLDPLKNGWMLEVEPNNFDQDIEYCRSGDALFSWYLKEFKWLESKLSEGFNHKKDDIGITLNDGGEISRNLRNYLPKEKYRHLVLNLLGVPESNS